MTRPTYFSAFDPDEIMSEYPIGEDFVKRYANISRDELRSIQERRFMRCIARGWQIPFYVRHWKRAGLEPGDIRSLDGLTKIPSYSKADLMKSVAEHPPYGDFHGIETFGDGPGRRPPVILQTTSGTTGTPQPLFFGPRSREIQNLLYIRGLLLQGFQDSDVVHSLYGFGTVNAGHYIREAITHFTSAMILTASTGTVTPSRQQVAMMKHFKATVLVGFADYVRKLAEVAREEGIEPGKDIPIRMICSSIGGESRDFISKAWAGAEVYDLYGVGDTGIIASETRALDGLTIWEDAHLVEFIDPETLEPLPEGRIGNICVTCLYKDDIFPNIRFNTNDLSAMALDGNKTGWTLKRMRGFLGRSDGMVKLRGINVYPTAVGELIRHEPGVNGEFLCEVWRGDGPHDQMTVHIEVTAGAAERPAMAERFRGLLRERIGVGLEIALVDPGTLADQTGLEARQKAVRLVDRRKFDTSGR